MLTRLPLKFLSTHINAQILRDGLAHSLKMEAIFQAGRSGKAGYTSQPTISTSMKRTCHTCAVFVVKKVSDSVPRKERDDIYISGWCGL